MTKEVGAWAEGHSHEGSRPRQEPMQWNSGPNAGFCVENVKPWMRVMDDYHTSNAKDQMKVQDESQLSVWQFWQSALLHRSTRKSSSMATLKRSRLRIRTLEERVRVVRWLVVWNFSGTKLEYKLPESLAMEFWAYSNYTKGRTQKRLKGPITPKAWEGVLGKCKVNDGCSFERLVHARDV
jgi:oligo-1,6-glucosidase